LLKNDENHHPLPSLIIWVLVTIGIGAYFGFTRGHAASVSFYTGYLLELSLSIDNLFIFLVVFEKLLISPAGQVRCLRWGIIGAIVFRMGVILPGTYIVNVRFLKRFVPIGPAPDNAPVFWFKEKILADGKPKSTKTRIVFTSLALAVVIIECADILFALDSVPAIFAVTTDPWIVIASNLLAIFTLRSVFFLIAPSVRKYPDLRYGIASILLLAGGQMILALWHELPVEFTLIAIVLVVFLSTRRKVSASGAKP
jgi:tellurite resistance protein TerC